MDFLVIVLLRVAFGTTSRKRRAVVEVLVQIGPVSAHLCRSDGATERERERENKALVSVREREREKEKKKKRVERERERERERDDDDDYRRETTIAKNSRLQSRTLPRR